MTEDSPDGSARMRISDADREAALQALGEHVGVGRISLDEYGERSARITALKTRGELAEVFADLPAPRPALGGDPLPATPAAAPVPAPPPVPAQQPGGMTATRQFAAAVVPIAAVVGVVLFFVTGTWIWFLLPAAAAVIGGHLSGVDRHRLHRDRHERHRVRHQQRRDRRRLGH